MTLFRLRKRIEKSELHVNCEVGLDIFCEVDSNDC